MSIWYRSYQIRKRFATIHSSSAGLLAPLRSEHLKSYLIHSTAGIARHQRWLIDQKREWDSECVCVCVSVRLREIIGHFSKIKIMPMHICTREHRHTIRYDLSMIAKCVAVDGVFSSICVARTKTKRETEKLYMRIWLIYGRATKCQVNLVSLVFIYLPIQLDNVICASRVCGRERWTEFIDWRRVQHTENERQTNSRFE